VTTFKRVAVDDLLEVVSVAATNVIVVVIVSVVANGVWHPDRRYFNRRYRYWEGDVVAPSHLDVAFLTLVTTASEQEES